MKSGSGCGLRLAGSEAFTSLSHCDSRKRWEPSLLVIETALTSIRLPVYPLVDQHPRFDLHFHGESEHAPFKSARLVPEHWWTALASKPFRLLEGDLADPVFRGLMQRYVDSNAAVCLQFVGIHVALSSLIYFLTHQLCILVKHAPNERSLIYAYSAISQFGMTFEGAFMRIRLDAGGE